MAKLLDTLTKPFRDAANKIVDTVKEELNIKYEPEDESLTANVKGLIKQATTNAKKNIKKKVEEYEKTHQEDVINPEPTPEPEPKPEPIINPEPIPTVEPETNKDTTTRTLFAFDSNDPDVIKDNEAFHTELELKKVEDTKAFLNNVQQGDILDLPQSDGTTEQIVYDPKEEITSRWWKFWEDDSGYASLFLDVNSKKKDESLYTQFLTDVAHTKDGKMTKEELSKKYESVFDRVTMDYKDFVKKYPDTKLSENDYKKLQDSVANSIYDNPELNPTRVVGYHSAKRYGRSPSEFKLDDVLKAYDEGKLDYDYKNRDLDKHARRAIHSQEELINLYSNTDTETIQNVYSIVQQKSPAKDEQKMVEDTMNIFQTVASNLNFAQSMEYYNQYVGIQKLLNLKGDAKKYEHLTTFFTNKVNDVFSFGTDIYYNPAALQDHSMDKYQHLGSVSTQEILNLSKNPNLTKEEKKVVEKVINRLYEAELIEDYETLGNVIDYTNAFIKDDENRLQASYTYLGERLKDIWDWSSTGWGQSVAMIQGDQDLDPISAGLKNSLSNISVEARSVKGKYDNKLFDSLTGEEDKSVGNYHVKYANDSRRAKADMVTMFGRDIFTDPLTLATLPMTSGVSAGAKFFARAAKVTRLNRVTSKLSKVIVGIDKTSKSVKLVDNFVANSGKTWLSGMTKWALDEVGLDIIMANAQKTEYNNTDLSIDIATGIFSAIIKTREIRSFLNGRKSWGVDDSLIRMYLASKGKKDDEIETIMQSMSVDNKTKLGEEIRKDLLALGDKLPKGELNQNVFEEMLLNLDKSSGGSTAKNLSNTLNEKVYKNIEQETQRLLNNAEYNAKELLANNGSKLVSFVKNENGGEDLVWNPNIKNSRQKGLNQYTSGNLNFSLSRSQITKNRISRGSKVANDLVVDLFGKEYKKLGILEKMLFNKKINKEFSSKKEVMQKILNDGRLEFFTYLHLTKQDVRKMTASKLKKAYTQFVNDSDPVKTKPQQTKEGNVTPASTKAEQILGLLTGDKEKFGNKHLPRDVFYALQACLKEMSPSETLRFLNSLEKTNTSTDLVSGMVAVSTKDLPSVGLRRLLRDKRYATIDKMPYTIKRVDRNTIKLVPTETKDKSKILYLDLSGKYALLKDADGKILEQEVVLKLYKKRTKTDDFTIYDEDIADFLKLFGVDASPELVDRLIKEYGGYTDNISALKVLEGAGVLDTLKKNNFGNWLIEFVLKDKINELKQDRYELHSFVKELNEEFNSINAFEKKFPTNGLSFVELHDVYLDALGHKKVGKEVFDALHLDDKSIIDRMAAVVYSNDGIKLNTSAKTTKAIATARQKRILEVLYGKQQAKDILASEVGFLYIENIKKAQKALGLSDDELVYEIQKGNGGFIQDIVKQFSKLNLSVEEKLFKDFAHFNDLLSQITNRIPENSEWKTAPEDKQHFLEWLDDIEDANNMKERPNNELNDLIKEARDFYKSFDLEEFEDRLMQELFRSNYNKIYHFSDDSKNIYTQSLIEQKVWGEGWVGVMQYMNDYFQKHIAAKTIYVWNDGNIEVLRGEPLQAEIDAVKESIQEKIKKGINFGGYYDPASKSIVYNAGQATYVDVNHEGFHSSIALCFSDAEREEIHKLFLDVFDKHKNEIMNNATQRGYLGGLAGMSETEIKLFLTEEWLAERYGEWATGKMINKTSYKERKEMGLPDGYGRENILGSKVINFFKRLWTRMQLLFHPEVRNKVMDLFEKVYNRTDIVKKDLGQTLPEGIKPTTLDKFSLHPKDKIKLDGLVSDEGYTDSNGKKYVLLDGKIFSATDWNVDPNNIIRSDSVSISGRSYAPNDLEQYRTVKLSNKQETNYHDLLESMIGENIEGPSKRIYNQLKNNIGTDPNTASQSFFVDIPMGKDREKRLTFSLSNNDPKYLDYEVSYTRPKSKWVSDTMRFHVFIKKKYNNTGGVNVTDATLTSVANMATLSYFMKEKNIFLNYSDQIALLAEARYKSLFYPIDNPYKAKLLQGSNYDNNLEAINEIETLNRFNLLIPDGGEGVYATLTQGFKEYRDKKIIEVLRKSNIPFKYYLNPNGTVNIEFQLTDKNGVVSTVGFHIQSKNLTSDQIKRLLGRGTQNPYPMQTQYTKHVFGTMLTDSELNRKNLENIVNFDKNVSDTIKQTGSNPDGIVKMSLSRLPENTEEKKFLIDYYTSIVNDKSKTGTDKELMEDLTLYKTKDNTYILRSVGAPFSIVKFLELDELKALACNGISVNSRYTISDTKYFGDEFDEDEVGLVFSTRNNKDLFNRMTVTYGSVRTYNMQETLIGILAYDVWNKFYKQTGYDISCLGRIDPKDADKIRKRVYPYIADILEKYGIYSEFMCPDLLNDFIKVYNGELIKPNHLLAGFNINRYIYDLGKDVDGRRDNSVVIEYINKFYSNRNPELNLDNDMSIEKALKASRGLPFQKGTIIPSQKNALELINKIFGKDMSDWANDVKGTLRWSLELPLSDMKDLDKIKDFLISRADSQGWDFDDFKNLSDLKQKEVLYILLGVGDYNDLQPLGWTSYTDIHDVRFITTGKDPEHLKNELESFNKNKDIHYVPVSGSVEVEKLQSYIDEADKRSDHYIFIVNSEYASQTLPYVNYSRSRIQSNKLIDDIGTTDFETVDVLDPSTPLEEKAMSLKAISGVEKTVPSEISADNMVDYMVNQKGLPNDAFVKYSLSRIPEDSGLKDYLYRYYKSVHGVDAPDDEAIKEDMTIYKTKEPDTFLIRSSKEPFVITHESSSTYWLDDLIEHGSSLNASVAISNNTYDVGTKFGEGRGGRTFIGYFTSKDHGGVQDQSLLERCYFYGDDSYSLIYQDIANMYVFGYFRYDLLNRTLHLDPNKKLFEYTPEEKEDILYNIRDYFKYYFNFEINEQGWKTYDEYQQEKKRVNDEYRDILLSLKTNDMYNFFDYLSGKKSNAGSDLKKQRIFENVKTRGLCDKSFNDWFDSDIDNISIGAFLYPASYMNLYKGKSRYVLQGNEEAKKILPSRERLLSTDKGLRFGDNYYQSTRSVPRQIEDIFRRLGINNYEKFSIIEGLVKKLDIDYKHLESDYGSDFDSAIFDAMYNQLYTRKILSFHQKYADLISKLPPEDMVALYKYVYRHANYRYLEGWQPTMRMDDLKILTITKDEDLATYRDKLEKAGYKVIDLNNTTLEEKQAIIDANDDIKTKFILPYEERTDVVDLKFSRSRVQHNSTVENILKDFEPTVQKYEAMDYNTYYIPTSTNGKPVRIYEMINSAKQYPKSITFVDYDDNLVYRIKELVDQGKTDIGIRLPKIENEKLFYDKGVDKEYKSYDGDDEFTNQLLEKIKSDCDVYEGKDGSILVKEKGNPIFIAKGTNSEMLDEILRSGDEGGITFSFGISDKYPETLDAYGGITIFLTNKDDSMFKDFYYFYGDGWTIEPRQVAALQLLEHDKKAAKEMYGDNYKEAYKIIKDQSLLQDRRYVDDFFDSKIATKKNLNVIKKEHPEWFTKKEIEKIYNKYGLTVGRRVHIHGFKLSASGKEKYYFIGDTLDKRTTNKYNKLVESMPIKLSLYADTTGLIDVVKIIEDINNGKFDEAMGKNKQYDEFKKLDNGEQQAIMAYILNKHFGQKLSIEGNMIEGRRARMESKYLKGMVINSDSELDSTIQAIKNNGYKYDLIDQGTLSNTVKLQDRLNKADDKTLFVIDNSNGAVRNLDNLGEVMFSRSRTLSDEERIDVLDSIVHRNGFKDTSISYLNRVKQLNKASKDLGVTKRIKDTSSIKTKNSNRRGPSKQIAFIKEADAALQGRREVVNQIKEQEKNIRNIRNSAPYKLLERISELTKTNPSIIKELKRPAKNIPVLDTKAKNIDINNNSFGDVAPVGYLDKKYGDISSMQQWVPQEEIELNKTYGKFEIIPYTKESEGKIDFTAKDNFVLRSNDGYSFFKMKNQLDRLDANHVKVYERDGSNIAYYSRNRNNQEGKDTIKDGLDLFDEVSGFTSVCHI